MTDYRRANFPGGYYFFTVVTYRRRKIFLQDLAHDCLRFAMQSTKEKFAFDIIAMCLLPDHLHCIWKLPDGEANFSLRWSSIKNAFSRKYLELGGSEIEQSKSRTHKRERGIWQRRFWEHQIRDETDLQRHIDYIHYNPVKHGLVISPEDWPLSTYHRYLANGLYESRTWQKIKPVIREIVAGE